MWRNRCGVEEVPRVQEPDQQHDGAPRRSNGEQANRCELRRTGEEDGAKRRSLNQ